jgi:hypothetical protein
MKTYPSRILKLLPVGLALVAAGVARAQLKPIALAPGSFNADVIVEQGVPSLGTNTTATTDGGTNDNGNSWFEIGYGNPGPGGATAGVPHAGTLLTNVSDIAGSVANPHIYQLAPSWAAPNAVLIDSGVLRTNAVITISPAGGFSQLSFLVASGNGGGNVNVRITHADSTIETNFVVCSDWFNGANPAFSARGRLNVVSGGPDTQASITSTTDGYGNPRWYSRDITLTNTTSAITSIQLYYGTGAANVHNQIYGLAGSSGGAWTPLAVSGYTDDLIVESNGVVVGATISPVTGTNATSQSMDNNVNTANSWYEQNFYSLVPQGQNKTGLPHPSATLTNSTGDHIFQFASSYQTNDSFYLNPSNLTATATLSTSTNYTLLSFLNASGNGPVPIGIVVTHADTTTESNNISSLDWFNGSGKIYGNSGRVAVDTHALNNENYPYVANGAPYLYFNDILLANTSSPVTSITMYYLPTNAAGRTAIFAISGTQGATAPLISSVPSGTNIWPVVTGSNAPVVLSAQATGIQPITYQWQIQSGASWVNVNNGPNGDGSTNSGATTATLTILNASTPGTYNYQVVAHNVGGSVTSTPPATVVVLSPLQDVAQAGDPSTGFPTSGDNEPNEGHEHAIDHLIGADPAKYLNFSLNNNNVPFIGPVGFTVTPSAGYSIVTGVRVYTANDNPQRDPADIEVYGSSNGGATWTLISTNTLALSDSRNSTASEDIGANINSAVLQQLFFANNNGYFSYKVQFTNVKNEVGGVPTASSIMQVAEVELLGVLTNAPAPSIQAPPNVVAYIGTNGVAFDAGLFANGYTINSTRWQVQTNGSYVNLADNANVSGSGTTNLTLNNVPFGLSLSGPSLPAIFNLQLVVNSSGGSVTSAPVTLTVISAAPNVLSSSDAISDFGNQVPGSGNNAATLPANAIDGFYVTYINTGVGPSAGAGFAPFAGPCGLIDSPAEGPTVLSGIRFFSGSESQVDDPANYTLEGSSVVGTNGPWTTISSGNLSLPSARNANVVTDVDPTTGSMQEIDFANTQGYRTYRVTFHDIVNDGTGVNVDIAELQLLGNEVPPALTVSFNQSVNQLSITSSGSGTVQMTTNLIAPIIWTEVGSITAGTPFNIILNPAVPDAFYRVSAP